MRRTGGTGSFAELTISGDAKFGLDYDSEPDDMKSKHEFKHEMGVDFTGSGTTDGGLTFGGVAGFDTGTDQVNEGKVFISGSFGTITIGEQDAADHLAGGIADVGLNGVGVDDVVEDIRGGTAHQFRYDQGVGGIALAISAGTSKGQEGKPNNIFATGNYPLRILTQNPGQFEVKKNSYAIGMSFSASSATFGIGYDSRKAISVGIGYSTGQISANAFCAKRDQQCHHLGANGDIALVSLANSFPKAKNGTLEAGYSGLGIDVSYSMGASTLTMVYAKTDLDNINPVWVLPDGSAGTGLPTDTLTFAGASSKGISLGFSHDLGGGAKLVARFAQVPQKAVGDLGMADIGQHFVPGNNSADLATEQRVLTAGRNVASVGLSFAF